MKVLIKWNGNYADEFSVEGFEIIEKEELDEVISIVEKIDEDDWDPEFSFGTNEWVEFSKEEFLETLKSATVLSDLEYDVITKHFGNQFGDYFSGDVR